MKDTPTSDDTIVVRPFNPGDLDEICAIEAVSFKDPWSRRSFIEELNHSSADRTFWVIAHGPWKVMGYCICHKVVDELYIKKIAVAPWMKRCGLGRRLLTFVVEYAKKNTIIKISLDCDETNHEAQAFYEAMGFERATPRGLLTNKIVFVKELN